MKKLIICLLSFICIIMAVVIQKPTAVSADDNEYKTWDREWLSYFERGDFRYYVKKETDTRTKTNGEVWIEAAYNKELTGKITIPKEVKRKSSDKLGYDVVGICTRGFSSQKITGITIGANVREIGKMAFRCCEKLKKVSFPSGLLYIDEEAFGQCKSLETVSIPKKVKTIEKMTFSECTALTKVTIEKSVTKIGDGAFSSCFALKKVTLSKKLKELGSSAFIRCRELKSITLPSTLKSIGDYCFEECANLEKVIVPNGVTKIGFSTFRFCTNLKKVVLGDKVTSIGASAFSECKSLSDINIPKELSNIGDCAFSGTAITEFDFPDTLKMIGSHAFAVCTELSEAVIPEGVDEIGEYAFGECSSLRKISIPSTVKIIPNSMCYSTSLTEVILAEGIEEIGDSAFGGTKLAEVSFPKSIKKIESTSFAATPFEQDIYLKGYDTDDYIEYFIINGNLMGMNRYEYYGGDLYEDGKIFFANKNGYIEKRAFEIPSGVTRILCTIGNGFTKEVKLPEGVEYISEMITGCFEELELPSSLKYVRGISSYELKSLKLPENLEKLPDLYGCSSLESIYLPSGITRIDSSDPYTGFSGCVSLKEIINGDGIIYIAEGAFAETAITDMKIPKSCEFIGTQAFKSGTTLRIHEDSKLLENAEEFAACGYKIVKYK